MQTRSVWGQLSPFLFLHRKGVEGREMGSRHPAPSLNDWGISQISVPRFLSGEVDHSAPECNFSIWLGLKQCRISLLNFFTIVFFLWWNYPPGGRQGFGIAHSAFRQAVRYGAGRSDSKARPLRHQGETARHNLEAAGHWGNELTPCDPPLQGFSGLEKDNANVYSKLFPGKKYKNKILPKKSHPHLFLVYRVYSFRWQISSQDRKMYLP